MSKSPKTKEKTKVKKAFKCHHCKNDFKSKAGLTLHVKHKHAGNNTAIGSKKGGDPKMLTPAHEAFCILYASDHEFFGNGVQSYIEAYDVEVVAKVNPKSPTAHKQKTYNYCKTQAHNLLTQARILNRVNEIFEGRGLNDAFVDKQLEFVITQGAELGTKVKGIVEYNKLKKRTSDNVEHIHAFSDIKGMSDEELAAEKKKLQDFFQKK